MLIQSNSPICYYKVTNQTETHYGYQYKNGLNILDGFFDETGSCVAGGFYFTTANHIHHYYNYGVYIRQVYLPTDDPEFKMVEDPEGSKWRANKIILGMRYCLSDPSTYIKLGIRMMEMDYTCTVDTEYIDILNWWLFRSSNAILKYSTYAMDNASANGKINVLNWWLMSGLPLKYSEDAIDYASANNHVNVLNWWKSSNLQLKYSPYAINHACSNNHIDVLKWWQVSGLKMRYTSYALRQAQINNNSDILQWCNDNLIVF